MTTSRDYREEAKGRRDELQGPAPETDYEDGLQARVPGRSPWLGFRAELRAGL